MTIHPDEAVIQDYALESSSQTVLVRNHIDTCPICQAGLAQYKTVAQSIQEMEWQDTPLFMTESVLAKLPHRPKKAIPAKARGFLFVIILAGLLPFLILLFTAIIAFPGISNQYGMLLLAAGTSCLLFLLLFDAWQTHRKSLTLIYRQNNAQI